jgi:hypothetical protein
MNQALAGPTGAVTTSPPGATTYTVPKVSGDAEAAFRLARGYEELAASVTRSRVRVGLVLGQLSGSWRGPGHDSLHEPAESFLRNAALLARTLDEAAAAFHAYGQHLVKAHEHHRWSMHKLLAVGAVVAVSATAIVVTVGAAGAVEAAAATAAVSGASEAVDSAVLADAVAGASLDATIDALPTLRALSAFVLPHLVQSEWAMGSMAAYQAGTTGRLQWRGLAETGGLAFIASGAATKGTELVGESAWLPHLVEGSTWAGAAAADDELLEHRLDLTDVAESFVLAGGATKGREVLRAQGLWPEPPDYRRDALVGLLHRAGSVTDPDIAHELALLRQPVRDLQRGEIDLRLHEGPGHTIARHVGKSSGELSARLRTDRIPRASTYWDERGARDAVQQTLAAHRPQIARWVAAGCPATLRLRLHSAYDVGFAIDRRGRVSLVRHALVVLRRDQAGVVLVTSYPVIR